MSARDELILAAHRAFYQVEMLHEMPDGIQISPDHDRALSAAVDAVVAAERERIAEAIEAFLAPAECGCVDCTECALVRQLAAIARMPPQ